MKSIRLIITMDNNSSCTVHHCPKCGNKDFQSSRVLSIHMHTCNELFAPRINEPNQKCTHGQLTLAQWAEQIFQAMKRPHTSGTLPNVNRLSVQFTSSMGESCPQNDDDYMDVHNRYVDGDNDGYGTEFCNECDNSSANDHSITSSHMQYQYRWDLNPPPGVKFGIHLQHILSSHWGVDLKLYDRIVNLIKYHATTQATDFSLNKLYHRKELTKTLAELYNLGDLEPQLHQVMSDNSTVTVPVFDVKAVILSMLHDPKCMQPKNFVPGCDIYR